MIMLIKSGNFVNSLLTLTEVKAPIKVVVEMVYKHYLTPKYSTIYTPIFLPSLEGARGVENFRKIGFKTYSFPKQK